MTELADTLEHLENARQSLKLYRQAQKDLTEELARLSSLVERAEVQVRELEAQSVGQYKGRASWTHEQSVNARRSIRSVSGEWRSMGDLNQALPELDRALLEREVEWLVKAGALVWNGGRGVASKYRKVVGQ